LMLGRALAVHQRLMGSGNHSEHGVHDTQQLQVTGKSPDVCCLPSNQAKQGHCYCFMATGCNAAIKREGSPQRGTVVLRLSVCNQWLPTRLAPFGHLTGDPVTH
jgi:hypothetical protein